MSKGSSTLIGHQALWNATGWFLLTFIGIPSLGYLAFAPDSRVAAVTVLGTTLIISIPLIAFRCRIGWDSSGFQISKGFGKRLRVVKVRRSEVKALVQYGHYARGTCQFTLWAQLQNGRKFSVMLAGPEQIDVLERTAQSIATVMAVPLEKDESFNRWMKLVTNAHMKLPKDCK